jgi:hypothetical protein
MQAQLTLANGLRKSTNCVPEFAMLTACSRTRLDGNAHTDIQRLSKISSFNWSLFITAVKYHRTTPLAYKHLKEVIAEPSDNLKRVNDELRHLFIDHARRAADLTDELVSLLDIFDSHQIIVIPFKGPLIAERFYGDIALREYCDIDLLIDPKDAVKVVQILRSHGYSPCEWRNTKLDENFFASELLTKLSDGYTFQSDSKQIYVDLHWKIMPQKFFCIEPREVLRITDSWQFQGRSIESFNVETLLAILCAHGTKHGWQQLGWATDIAEIVQSEKVDWKALLATSRRAGVEQMVLLGLYLTTFLPGSNLPTDISARISAAPKAVAVGDEIMHRFCTNPLADPWSELEAWKYFLALKQRWSEKFALLIELATKPTIDEWCLFPLPTKMLFLYRVVRPISLLAQHGPRLALRALRK